jgi:poly(hydroxyalkanoate) depolymerase family esterase
MDVVLKQNSRKLMEIANFGSNPGALGCHVFMPAIMAPRTPLVVVLHGCTQTAESYDHGSGWTELAEKKGFALLFPEQRHANNANLCFNWFEPADIRRDAGEALSIRQMIDHVSVSQGIDRERVYVTGLSAGGAMALVMLAAYPELFAGGAIIGGLPYGAAASVAQAFERMQGRNMPDRSRLRSALAAASAHAGPWPRLSIWHGTHDHTVKPVNAQQIALQWGGVHRITDAPDRVETVNGHTRKAWLDEDGNEAIELYSIRGMAHGVPLSSGAKVPLGNTGPFMLDAGISSTARIARSWGLAGDHDVAEAEGVADPAFGQAQDPADMGTVIARAMAYVKPRLPVGSKGKGSGVEGVGKVINDALRAAGLIR